VTAQDVIRALERKGFALIRQSGSHKDIQKSRRNPNNSAFSVGENSASKALEGHHAGCGFNRIGIELNPIKLTR
jgi:HicA toxin of bacterial toxin-antitoxin,